MYVYEVRGVGQTRPSPAHSLAPLMRGCLVLREQPWRGRPPPSARRCTERTTVTNGKCTHTLTLGRFVAGLRRALPILAARVLHLYGARGPLRPTLRPPPRPRTVLLAIPEPVNHFCRVLLPQVNCAFQCGHCKTCMVPFPLNDTHRHHTDTARALSLSLSLSLCHTYVQYTYRRVLQV